MKLIAILTALLMTHCQREVITITPQSRTCVTYTVYNIIHCVPAQCGRMCSVITSAGRFNLCNPEVNKNYEVCEQ